jgi:branched-chain amino acid transport system substrate-binding protein
MKKIALSFILLLSLISSNSAKEFNLYLDADLSIFKSSGDSIAKGVQAALDFYKQENKKSSVKINFIPLDHRGNTRRSLINYQKIVKDPKAIAVFGGLHSPPLITNNEYINKEKMLTLVPWAAGGPITRIGKEKNWFFRLSLDDAQVGGYIAKYSIEKQKCSSPFLLLESTPWGRSNEKNMKKGLKKYGKKPVHIQFFNWGVSRPSSLKIAKKVKETKADCLFFVGNSRDAKNLFMAISEEKTKISILSHWGITGGKNSEMAEIINTNKLDVQVVQTNFSFFKKNLNPFQEKVKKYIFKKYNLNNVNQISPMSGWVHSFDLTLIFLSTLDSIDLTGDILTVRKRIKDFFESESVNTVGLIKNYKRAFKKPSVNIVNAHEALSSKEYRMRRFVKGGSIK